MSEVGKEYAKNRCVTPPLIVLLARIGQRAVSGAFPLVLVLVGELLGLGEARPGRAWSRSADLPWRGRWGQSWFLADQLSSSEHGNYLASAPIAVCGQRIGLG